MILVYREISGAPPGTTRTSQGISTVVLLAGDKVVPIASDLTIQNLTRIGVPLVPMSADALTALGVALDPNIESTVG